MENINGCSKYPEGEHKSGQMAAGKASDYRFHYGFVSTDNWRVKAALGLPHKPRRFWQGILLAVVLGLAVGFASVVSLSGSAAAGDLPFRLHIIANSDSAADQALKLQVRDAVVEYLTPLLAEVEDAARAEEIVMQEVDNLQQIAGSMCAEFGYGATAEVGNFDFPAKRYGSVVLPAGEYHALRLNLGAAAGHNWWCVIFPPLCFVDECGELSTANLSADAELLGAKRVVRLKLCDIFSEAQ